MAKPERVDTKGREFPVNDFAGSVASYTNFGERADE